MVITDQRGRRIEAPDAVVEIHGADLWVFIVGMLWRSYRDGAVPLTRLSTDTYLAALDIRGCGRRPKPSDDDDASHREPLRLTATITSNS